MIDMQKNYNDNKKSVNITTPIRECFVLYIMLYLITIESVKEMLVPGLNSGQMSKCQK